MKDECFVIMPIDHPEVEFMWNEVYEPIINSLGYLPVRIDENDDGTLMPVQIVQYLNNSKLLIADLTMERPNCYFEVGFAMGLNRYSDLILCCRDDHNIYDPGHDPKGPKAHFDLNSHGILWWNKEKLDIFKKELQAKIKKRLSQKPKRVVDLSKSTPSNDLDIDSLIDQERGGIRKWMPH